MGLIQSKVELGATAGIVRILAPALIVGMLIVSAPFIGLGSGNTFLLYREFGLSRSDLLNILTAFIEACLLVPIFLAVISSAFARRIAADVTPKSTGALKCCELKTSILFGEWRLTRRGLATMAAIGLIALFLFIACLWKHGSEYATSTDQHWHQSLIDSMLEFGEFSLSLVGNPLYNFGIQLPINAHLLPLDLIAHQFPAAFRIPIVLSGCFLVAYALSFVLGATFGLRSTPAMVFASALALLMMTRGLDHLFWITPREIDWLFSYALWWGEEPFLLLATILAYLWIGIRRNVWINISAAVIFAVGSFAIVLGYPVGAVFFVPLVAIYCAAFLFTSHGQELAWKVSTGVVLGAAMLAVHVPSFLIYLYSYTFSDYFFELFRLGSAAHPIPPYSLLTVIWQDILSFAHANDYRTFFVFNVAMLCAAWAALRGSGPLRRIAVACLACELMIVVISVINQFYIHAPIAANYAEVGQAPIWVGFFVLACMFAVARIDNDLVSASLERKGAISRMICWGAANARPIFCTVIAVAALRFLLLEPSEQPPWVGYPAARPESIAFLSKNLALSEGSPFRGRLLTLGTSRWNGKPDWADLTGWGVFASNFTRYRASTGNDHFIDATIFSIPTANEYAHWTSPVYFSVMRSFFSRSTDSFGKALIPLRAFDLRIARALGIRMVVTDRNTLPGGTLVYSSALGKDQLNIFEIERANLGQFSPTQLHRIATAKAAIELLQSSKFDPEQMAIVENQVPYDLVTANSARITVAKGPRLEINADSPGRSLLVLPFEYSHCLDLRTINPSARLYPVDLFLSGLLFEGHLHATVEYRYGIFENHNCRRADVERADRLHLRDLFLKKTTSRGPSVSASQDAK